MAGEVRTFLAHVGSYESTDTMVINVPTFANNEWFDTQKQSMEQIIANYPFFNPTCTWVSVEENRYSAMLQSGFASGHVIQGYFYNSSTQPLILYFTSDRWLSILINSPQQCEVTYHVGNVYHTKDHSSSLTGFSAFTFLTLDTTVSTRTEQLSIYDIDAPRFRAITSSTETTAALADFYYSFWDGVPPYTPSIDPYGPGGESDTGGGDGTFDDTSVPVPVPGLPGISAVDTKFITLYNPTLSELQSLARYMWSSFDLNTFRKLFADPMDCILGLSIVPVAVPDGGQAEVKVGNIGTGVQMNKAGAQYVTVDCGSLTVERYWGAYLDYAPYTRAEIYLPYIGAHALAMDDIMGKTVHVVYNIDILSGACAAFLECDGTVLYTFTGQCSSSIPISGNDFTSVINGILGAACSIGSTVLSGGAAAPAAVSSIASLATNVMKPTVEKSGAMAGTGGMLSVQVPYLILTRPKQAIPGSQNKEMGYPAFITRVLGNVSGYTEIESVHITGIPCTSQELVEIEAALKEGVIL